MNSIPLLLKFSGSRNWLTIGFKLILGITLASNLCIGILLFTNWQSSREVKQQFAGLLQTHAELSHNLRETIYELQENYQQISGFFNVDKTSMVTDWIKSNFTIEKEETLTGRNAYKSLFNRTARRDLSKGRFVVQVGDGGLYVSRGLQNADKEFNDSVSRMKLASEQSAVDQQRIIEYLDSQEGSEMDAALLNNQLTQLNSFLADAAINSEKTRTEILYRVEDLRKKEDEVEALQYQKQQHSVLIGIATIFINIIVLFALTGIIVERPLRKLTGVISAIQAGHASDIPYLNRKDKIGILANAIGEFREAMKKLKEEDKRKAFEKNIIDEFINNLSRLIQHLQGQSEEMADNALNLNELAQLTEEQSTSVTANARNTAANANAISKSTRELQRSVGHIVDQIKRQNELVSTVSMETVQSKTNIHRLQETTEQIHGIIKMIKEITQKSKLLALNATIEAARYGQRGAGFLVVADEMKALSSQTETAADDITTRTEAIYSAGQIFVTSLYQIEEKVQNLTEVTAFISSAAESQNAETGSIARTVLSTSEDSQDVSARIGKVNVAAAETRKMASKVLDYSENITAALSDILLQTQEKLRYLTTSGFTGLPRN